MNEYIADARNHLVEDREGDYVLFMDSDQEFGSTIIEDLLKHDVPIVAPIVHKKTAPYLPVIYQKAKDWDEITPNYHAYVIWPLNQPFKVDMVGTGCVLIREEVFNTVTKPYFQYTEKCGEDMYFFLKTEKAGYTILIDPRLPIAHITQQLIDYLTYFKHNEKMLRDTYKITWTPELTNR